jgi:hypothetical protein
VNNQTPSLPENDPFCRSILNAIPVPVFVVDTDVRIVDHNEAGAKLLAPDNPLVMRQRGGEIWHCIHANFPEGCGQSEFCKSCVIRQCVAAASQGQKTYRQRARMEFVRQDRAQPTLLLVTASPFNHTGEPYVLLILEDISELITLRSLLPICAKCKKIRDDQQYWHSVESYFHAQLDVDFTHGLCPDCARELYPDIFSRLNPKKPFQP